VKMDREILFRGKVTGLPLYLQDKKKVSTWVYGSYLSYPTAQIVDLEDEYVVDPATVGQFTGLCDKNGVKIFEGDIVNAGYENANGSFFHYYSVMFSIDNGSWEIYNKELHFKRLTQITIVKNSIEVIGNIHDNPELLKEEKQ
jgi:uncharacterized phage protein (TIGR01671 family)